MFKNTKSALPKPLPQFLHESQTFTQPDNPDNIYYDITISNVQSTVTSPPALYYNENRNKPYVPVSGDYNLSIIRFELDTQTLPLFVPAIQPAPNANRDLTIYSVTMRYNGVDSDQIFLNWIPQDVTAPVPNPPSANQDGRQDTSTGYYNAYNFQWLIILIDNAFKQCLINLNGYIPLPTPRPPLITWDTANKVAVISAESQYWDVNAVNPIELYFNAPLFTLFNTFVAQYLGYGGVLLGKNYRIVIADFTGTNTITLPTNAVPPTPTFIYTQMYQENCTLTSWSPISSIVFCSSTLPIVPNNLSAPLVFNDLAQLGGGGSGNNSNIAPIVTDFTVSLDAYSPYVLYNPTAEFRRISLTGNGPLTNFDLSVFWKDKLGNFHPFLLASGGNCNIKIMFEKKKANKKSVGGN